MVAPKPITGEELTFLSTKVLVDSSSPSGLVWKDCGNNRVKNGSTAGGLDQSIDYWKIEWTFKGKRRKRSCHTLVMELSGKLSPGKNYEVDHIDRDRSNNRIENLRWYSRSDQCINRKQRANPTGFPWVNKRNQKYVVHFSVRGKRYWKGGFTTAEAAHAAAVIMREQLGLDGPKVLAS